jgi:hypothetical protein
LEVKNTGRQLWHICILWHIYLCGILGSHKHWTSIVANMHTVAYILMWHIPIFMWHIYLCGICTWKVTKTQDVNCGSALKFLVPVFQHEFAPSKG